MKLAIMQPYFFPYLGYWQLFQYADTFLVFDDIQFVHKGWVNRNRILHQDPSKEWRYITVPLRKKSQKTKILDISTLPAKLWRDKLLAQLTTYRKAPHYEETMALLGECLDCEEQNLARFLTRAIKITAKHLGLETEILVQSELGLDIGPVEHSGQWALRLSEAMGAIEYVNPMGGMDLFRESEFDTSGIKLRFLDPLIEPYNQRRDSFVPSLSILDILMWNPMPEVTRMLQSYRIRRSGHENRTGGTDGDR